jgi:hypothetical protein
MKKILFFILIFHFGFSQDQKNVQRHLTAFELDKAYPLIVSLSNQGIGEYQYYLGLYYEYGVIVKQDEKKALELYLKSVDNGCKKGYSKAGLILVKKELEVGLSKESYPNLYKSKGYTLWKKGIENGDFFSFIYFYWGWLGDNKNINFPIMEPKEVLELFSKSSKFTNNDLTNYKLEIYLSKLSFSGELSQFIPIAKLQQALIYMLNPEEENSAKVFSTLQNPEKYYKSQTLDNKTLNNFNVNFYEQDLIKSYSWFLIYNEEKRYISKDIQLKNFEIIKEIQTKLTDENQQKAISEAEKNINKKLINIDNLFEVENKNGDPDFYTETYSYETGTKKVIKFDSNHEIKAVEYFKNNKLEKKRTFYNREAITDYFYDANGIEIKKSIIDPQTFLVKATYTNQ